MEAFDRIEAVRRTKGSQMTELLGESIVITTTSKVVLSEDQSSLP
jgi:hypothetical protein